MRVVSPSFEILTPIDADEALKLIENVGRTCYKSEDKITDESALPFVSGIIKRGHEAVIEHSAFIFELNEASYSKMKNIINLLEDYGFNSFLRITYKDRPVVSANVRAWREFIKWCLAHNVGIPEFMSDFIHSNPVLFPEFQEIEFEKWNSTENSFKELNVYDLKDETEWLTHIDMTAKVITDRGVTHEIVRHRIASYAQESTRYVCYSDKPNIVTTDDEVIDLYLSGLSMKKISDRSNGKYTEWDVYKLLEQNDVEKRSKGSRGIVNKDYFSKINTPEKAYLLGFIQADGCLRKDLSQLTISQKEDEQWWLLNMVRDFIQPKAKSLTIHNAQICNDLYRHGIVPNKTYKMDQHNATTLWNSVPEEFKYDFLRGLLDGDGNIRWFCQKENSKTQSCNIGFTGNIYLMKLIQNFLMIKFNYHVKVHEYDTYARLSITDSKVGKEFCENLYKNFKFPYGHSKTARYFEAFELEIPIKTDMLSVKNFNVILPTYEINGGRNGLSGQQLWVWGNAMFDAERHYNRMIELGATPQIARSVLNNSTKTEICITMNLAEWRHFFKLRCAPSAHPQMREIAIMLLKAFKTLIPHVFDDIEVAA